MYYFNSLSLRKIIDKEGEFLLKELNCQMKTQFNLMGKCKKNYVPLPTSKRNKQINTHDKKIERRK